jgi:hypothetical protein
MSSMMARTFFCVSLLIRLLPDMTRLTVEGETPALLAISFMVLFMA